MPAKPLHIDALGQETIPWKPVEETYLKYRIISLLLGFVVTVAVIVGMAVIIGWLVPQVIGWDTSRFVEFLTRPLVLWLFVAAIVIELVIDLIVTIRRCKSLKYAEREEDFLLRYGVLFHRMWAVPYGRIQSAEVRSGPLERAFGLARLQLRTAGVYGNITLPGLSTAKADELREDLVARGQARLAGL